MLKEMRKRWNTRIKSTCLLHQPLFFFLSLGSLIKKGVHKENREICIAASTIYYFNETELSLPLSGKRRSLY